MPRNWKRDWPITIILKPINVQGELSWDARCRTGRPRFAYINYQNMLYWVSTNSVYSLQWLQCNKSLKLNKKRWGWVRDFVLRRDIEGMQQWMRREEEVWSGGWMADVKARRSQRFPLNLQQTTDTECLLQKAEWLIIMAACFNLIPSASQGLFLEAQGDQSIKRAGSPAISNYNLGI